MNPPIGRPGLAPKRGRQWKWLALASLVAAPVLWSLVPRLRVWQLERDAGAALAAVASCLVGSDGSEELAGERLRAVAIQASLDGAEGSWPGHCAPYVGALGRALARVHAERASCEGDGCCGSCDQLRQLRDEVDRAAVLTERGYHDPFDPVRMLRLARDLGLKGRVDDDVPQPPRPVPLLRPRTMASLHQGNYLRLLTNPNGHDTIDLLFYAQERSYRLCGLRLVGDDHADCRLLAQSIPVGQAGMLLASEPGAPTKIYAQGPTPRGWEQGLFDARSGERIVKTVDRPAGGFVWRDGSFARLGRPSPRGEVSLFRVRGGLAEPGVPLGLKGTSLAPRLAHDEIVWAKPRPDHRHRIYARQVLGGERPLGPLVEIGDTPPMVGSPSMNTCRTEHALVMLVGGLPRGASPGGTGGWVPMKDRDPGAVATLMFRTAEGWQPPVPVRIGPRAGLTCQGETATLSWVGAIEEAAEPSLAARQLTDQEAPPVRGRYEIKRLRCAPGYCERQRAVVMLERYAKSSRYLAGDVGDSAVVFWRSPLGDVRMRIATLDALPNAPSRSLFDDLEHDGFGWDLEQATLFGRGGVVLMLVSAPLGDESSATYGFRVAADGRVTPVRVAGEHGQLGGAVMGRVARR